MLSAKYSGRGIWTQSAIEATLGHTVVELNSIIKDRAKYYHEFSRPKPSGGNRDLTRVVDPLSAIQGQIKEHLLVRVLYPYYLQGSVRDRESPRSALSNAKIHRSAKHIFTADIKSFFDHVTPSHVNSIWRVLFGFSPESSTLLTELTTFEGKLPQGTCTSPGLANLVFFQEEPYLVAQLESFGFRYSRYVDDITVSSPQHISSATISKALQSVRGMVMAKGFTIARRKQHFSGEVSSVTGNRQGLTITGYTVGQIVSVPSARRRTLEVDVHRLWLKLKSDPKMKELETTFRSLAPRVGQMKALHPGLHKRLKPKLDEVKEYLKAINHHSST